MTQTSYKSAQFTTGECSIYGFNTFYRGTIISFLTFFLL